MKYGLIALIIIGSGYAIWTQTGHTLPDKLPHTVSSMQALGQNAGRGNLLGIQPWMETTDYASQEAFQYKLSGYFEEARKQGYLIPNKTIVILPEYLGTWLVAMNEKASVYSARTVTDALTTLVLTHPIAFLTNYLQAPESVQDKTKYAVFAIKSEAMSGAYQQTFSALAAHYKVTIVAGSILLRNPQVTAGNVTVTNGQLYNVAAVFHPDGKADAQLVRKVFPIADELPFVRPAKATDVPVFNTPVGRLGVLVCADSWNPSVYKTLKQKGATLLAVPSYSAGNGIWSTTWKGYSGTETPPGARTNVGYITEGRAWLLYAMAGRAWPEARIRNGLNVFLRGNLWDLGSDGTSIAVTGETKPYDTPRNPPVTAISPHKKGASLLCLWL